MSNPECFKHCPHITACSERIITETQSGSASNLERVTNEVEALVRATAEVAIAACQGPRIETRAVQKNGFWESKRLTNQKVYVCGNDGYAQDTVFYYQTDKMPQ